MAGCKECHLFPLTNEWLFISASYYKMLKCTIPYFILEYQLVFWLVAMPLSSLVAGHTLVMYWLQIWMTRQILNEGSTHSVVKFMMYCVILVKGNPLLNYCWWKYTALVVTALFYGTWTILQLVLSVPHGERVYGGFACNIAAYYLLPTTVGWAVL